MAAPRRHQQPGPDLYQLLGLDPDASRAEITRAYRRLARSSHPDVDTTPGAAQRFDDITRAYSLLSDPETRARLDAGRARRTTRSPSTSAPGTSPPWTTSQAPIGSPREARLGYPSLTHAFYLGTDTLTSPRGDRAGPGGLAARRHVDAWFVAMVRLRR